MPEPTKEQQNMPTRQQPSLSSERNNDVSDPSRSNNRRNLYEQTQSKTLVFTSSTSSYLNQFDVGETTAFTGLYQCTLEPNRDDETLTPTQSKCYVASKLADGRNFPGRHHKPELLLRNPQFDLASLRTGKHNKSDNKNYLYANTHTKYTQQQKVSDWEIVRAELPLKGDKHSQARKFDGTLQFESVFHMEQNPVWNLCDYNCCIKNNDVDNPWGPEDHLEHRHGYSIHPRSFAVDEHTGDVFISWDGWYKDCSNLYQRVEMAKWTIGISRLKLEDPTCVFLGNDDKEVWKNHLDFERCMEVVAIPYQDQRAYQVMLSFGGFAVIPGGVFGEESQRSFLLSVLNYEIEQPFNSKVATTTVWAFSGTNRTNFDNMDHTKPQILTKPGVKIDELFMSQSVWDGGSLRLHYNRSKKTPDHLCRTLLEAGIECFPISVSVQDGHPVVKSTAKPTIFLSKQQAGKFCRLGDADRTKRPEWGRRTTVVTGLDVQWNEETGEPERIFFGCFGDEGGNGNFGSVEKNGENLMKVMDAAYSEAVLFLPQELEGTMDPIPESDWNTYSNGGDIYSSLSGDIHLASNDSHSGTLVSIIVGVSLLLCAAGIFAYKKMKSRDSRFMSNYGALQRGMGLRFKYIELQQNVELQHYDASEVIEDELL